MLDADTLTSFKLTTIRLIEEFLKERITQLDPDAIGKENINNVLIQLQSAFVEKHFQIPDEFWNLKYEWLQQAKSLTKNEKELQKFFNSEIRPYLDLFKDDKTLLASRITPSRRKAGSGKSKAHLSNRVGDTVGVTEDSLIQLCALRVAAELIQGMDLHNLSLSTLENLLGGVPKPVPVTE